MFAICQLVVGSLCIVMGFVMLVVYIRYQDQDDDDNDDDDRSPGQAAREHKI